LDELGFVDSTAEAPDRIRTSHAKGKKLKATGNHTDALQIWQDALLVQKSAT
jgi:hypothetical protein